MAEDTPYRNASNQLSFTQDIFSSNGERVSSFSLPRNRAIAGMAKKIKKKIARILVKD